LGQVLSDGKPRLFIGFKSSPTPALLPPHERKTGVGEDICGAGPS
jgi:hypothetical protein